MTTAYIPVQQADKKRISKIYNLEKRINYLKRNGGCDQEKLDQLIDNLKSLSNEQESRIKKGYFIKEYQ